MSQAPEYHAWRGIWKRCTVPTDAGYANYGGRGIQVDECWREFPRFLADVGRRPSSAYSLDRIDNDGPYAPGNCRWAVAKVQMANRRCTSAPCSDERQKTQQRIAELEALVVALGGTC